MPPTETRNELEGPSTKSEARGKDIGSSNATSSEQDMGTDPPPGASEDFQILPEARGDG